MMHVFRRLAQLLCIARIFARLGAANASSRASISPKVLCTMQDTRILFPSGGRCLHSTLGFVEQGNTRLLANVC